MFLSRMVASFVLVICTAPASATVVHFRSLEDVATESAVGVVVNVVEVGNVSEEGFFKVLPLKVEILDTAFGGDVPPGTYQCRYAQGMPHRRGDMQVSPLIDGSGIELETKAGDRRVLLLKNFPAFGAACEVLRMEPIEKRDDVSQAGHRGCCRKP